MVLQNPDKLNFLKNPALSNEKPKVVQKSQNEDLIPLHVYLKNQDLAVNSEQKMFIEI